VANPADLRIRMQAKLGWCRGCNPDNCCGCPLPEGGQLRQDLQRELDEATASLHVAQERLRAANKAADEWRVERFKMEHQIQEGDGLIVTEAIVQSIKESIFGEGLIAGEKIWINEIFASGWIWCINHIGLGYKIPESLLDEARLAYLAIYGKEEKGQST
jgi:hypothetical protein